MGTVYNNLDTVTHTLDEFTARLNSSFTNHDFDAFIKTGLTGEYLDDNGARKQVFIDPLLNHVQDDHQITITRNYNSTISISEDILVATSINVYAIPHPTFALSTSIHLKYPIQRDGSTKLVEYHRIPNFEFGTFGVRHHINIFFPGLWSQDRSKGHAAYRLTEQERTFWYDKAFRPAIGSLLGPAIASEWPASYRTEEIRARKHKGGHAWGSKIIPQRAVGGLMDRVRLLLGQDASLDPEDVAWAQNFFVMHTIRGVKHSNSHEPTFFEARSHLDTFFLSVVEAPAASCWSEGPMCHPAHQIYTPS
ncbi:hypothetical protein P691DRAFT_765570 [Macrolepiota fuliginosa MF-IS2]|uniref:Uncharacterized protein n=1 Tax=Macrolepiota fuliginosa MF-IS2 TaxID=1400762 RepID=A0A9P5X0N7_9AGAR|nr:hypothetical protein P691DRAFT_765570 [Macrolepiota fuliginosa MF-IS2]